MKRTLTVITIIMAIMAVFIIAVAAPTGSYTSHDLFYLPEYGASGVTEYDEYNTYMEIADQQIWANKEAIEGIEAGGATTEAELETQLTDVTDVYTDNDFDIADYATSADYVPYNGATTDLELGGHSLGALNGDFSGVIQAGTDDLTNNDTLRLHNGDDPAEATGMRITNLATGIGMNKGIGLGIDTDKSAWLCQYENADLEIYTNNVLRATFGAAGGLDVVGTIEGGTITDGTFSVNAGTITGAAGSNSMWTNDEGYLTVEADPSFVDWTVSQAPSVIHAGNYTDTDTTYTAGTGLDLTLLEFSLDASIGDLSDVDLTDIAADKILQYNNVTSKWECETLAGGGGYDNLTDFIDQTAWRLFYSDASGDVTELALGTDGQYLKSQGATSAPTWDTPAGGGGDITNWIIPQDYATGSGTSGDPWAGDCMDDAIAAASAGDTIYCRAGYYQLGGICTVSKAVNIIGEGIGKTIILGDAVEQGFLVSSVDRVTFKDFTIDGDDLTGTNPYCFQISTSDYTVLENIEAKNAGKIGINIVNSNHCYLNNIYAHDNGEHGIHIGASVGNDSDYNVLENLYLYNNTDSGLDAYSVAESAVYAEYNIYQNVMTWDNGQGIAIWGEKHSILNNASAYSNTTHGYYLFYLEDCQINNCVSILNGSSGATIYAQNVNFDNFTVKNNDTGIVAYASDELSFSNCQIYDDDAGTTQDYAFQFHEYESDACEGIRIDNCKITGNAEGTIADVDSSATYTVNGVSDGEQAAAGDIQYFNGTNWVLLTKDSGKYLKSGDAAVSWDTPAGGGASQLSDLSDVHTSTPTNKYVLVADGVDFESRQLTSDDLSDVSSIAMLDENELVTGNWTYNASYEYLRREHDTAPFILGFHRKRDGDPTSNVSNNDVLGKIEFYGYYWDVYEAAYIQAAIDNTPGDADMPGRLDFYTTADGASSGSLRMTIDSAGNLKYGDGAWTNYVNITNAGVLTLEGTANIEGCDATELSYLDGVTSDIQTQFGNYYLKTAIDTIGEMETIWETDITTSTEMATYCETTQNYLKTSENSDSDDDVSLDDVKAACSNDFHNIGGTDANTTYTGGDFLTLTGTDFDVDTAAVTDGDTTHLSSADAIYDFCETTQGYAKSTMDSDTDLNEHSIEVSAALSGDHSYSGIIDSQAVGESVVFGNLLYFNWTDKEWKLAKADAAATTPALAIALESKTDGQTCKLLRQGYIRDDTWNFTAAMVYLSDTTAGSVLSAAPSDSGDQVQRVGQAKSADIMYFNPSIDVGEI